MSAKSLKPENEYLCAIERNQNGKYTVSAFAQFSATDKIISRPRSPQEGWTLPVFSSHPPLMVQ